METKNKAVGKTTQKVKLCRLRDITLYHLKNHEGTMYGKTTLGQMDALEYDIKVWIKNFLLTLEELDASANINFVGETDAYEEESN